MEIHISDIVRSTAGRDKGKLFFVLQVEEQYALLVDGKLRKLENPKRKKQIHFRLESQCALRVAEKLRNGEKVTNSELRRTLAQFAAEVDGEEGGM